MIPDDEEKHDRLLLELQKSHGPLHIETALVASNWAMLEFTINKCIWILANLNPVAGACITSQIISMGPRIDCLLALMELRSMNDKSIGALNRFKQSIHGTQEKRNRLIHDPLVYNGMTGEAGKIEITARGKPVFRVREITLQEISDLRSEILRRMHEFGVVHEAIVEARDTLPEIPQPEADPMQVMMVLAAQKKPNG